MLTEERLQGIWRIVTEKGSASIQELMDALNISESTVRRDLAVLDEQGRIQKVRGGAMVVGDAYSTKEDSVTQKKDKNLAEKREIAKYAASLIKEDDFVYLDAGTTTELMIDYLTTKPNGICNQCGGACKKTFPGRIYNIYSWRRAEGDERKRSLDPKR